MPDVHFSNEGAELAGLARRAGAGAAVRPDAQEIAPQLGREDLLEAIHCVTPEGRVYRGARAIRFVGMRLPLLVPVALVLWIPGVIFLAEIIYRWVSRHRLLFSRVFGCKDACAILPARKREQDKLA